MGNKEILNLLNERTKQVIDDMFSFMDFFMKNEITAIVRDKYGDYSYFLNTTEELANDTIAYAFILSSFKNDKIIQKYFNQINITYDKLLDNFKIGDMQLSEHMHIYDFPFKDASETDSFKYIDLEKIFRNILTKVKYTAFLENENENDISIDKIEPYQIFDYLIEKSDASLKELLDTHMDFNQGEMDNLLAYFNKHYKEFAQSFNIDMEQKEEDEKNGITRYPFQDFDIFKKDDKYYITFKETADFRKMIKFDDPEPNDDIKYIMSLSLPATFQILLIDRKHVYDKMMERFSTVTAEESYDFKLKNTNDNTIIALTFDKYRTFITKENAKSYAMHSSFLDGMKNINLDDLESLKIYTPTLNKYGTNMTQKTFFRKPCVGRDNEIEQLELILSYPERDASIVITGESGCGKTALVEGLAYKIRKGEVPDHLKNLNIIKINVSSLIKGTKYVGTLEEKMEAIIKEASSSKNIVLFIDELHQALGAGASEKDNNSVSEILKPVLSTGEVRIIGATTTDEYFEYMCDDEAFKTRFKRVKLSEPDKGTIYQIIDNLIESYNSLEEKTKQFCPKLDLEDSERDQVIKWLISVTSDGHRRHDDSCSNPRLVIDIIKYAYATATMRGNKTVDLNDIAEALNKEERLNPDYKRRAIPELFAIKPAERRSNIIEFKLIKK